MKNASQEILALRQQGAELLSDFEDPKLLEHVVELIRQSYLEEIIQYGPGGKPISRAEFMRIMEKANASIERGEGIEDEEMEAWIENLPAND